MAKLIEIDGVPWILRLDSYRFYLRKGPNSPVRNWPDETSMLEFKHNDGPAQGIAELMFKHLPGKTIPDTLYVRAAVFCSQHGLQDAVEVSAEKDQFGNRDGKCGVCVREGKEGK